MLSRCWHWLLSGGELCLSFLAVFVGGCGQVAVSVMWGYFGCELGLYSVVGWAE